MCSCQYHTPCAPPLQKSGRSNQTPQQPEACKQQTAYQVPYSRGACQALRSHQIWMPCFHAFIRPEHQQLGAILFSQQLNMPLHIVTLPGYMVPACDTGGVQSVMPLDSQCTDDPAGQRGCPAKLSGPCARPEVVVYTPCSRPAATRCNAPITAHRRQMRLGAANAQINEWVCSLPL